MAKTSAQSVLPLLFGLFIFVAFSDSVTASSIDDLIPPSLLVPAGNKVQEVLFATGFQIYTYNGTAWILTNVSADLYNSKGNKVGHHFYLGVKDALGGQPTWERFHPFSSVTGIRIAAAASPFNDSIPWLLLNATTNNGSLSHFGSTTFIQRLFTQHGLAPDASFPAVQGEVFDSNYTALYKFSKKNASTTHSTSVPCDGAERRPKIKRTGRLLWFKFLLPDIDGGDPAS